MENVKKERTFTLQLSDKDLKALYIKAGEGGMTMGELLENFVRDLVFSKQSNGSDERQCAEAWYERCGFEMLAKRGFLSYMIRYENVERAVEIWDSLQKEEERIAIGVSDYCDQEDFESAKEDVRCWREELDKYYEDYRKICDTKGQGFETEMKELVEWYDGLRKLNRGFMP